MPLTVRREIPDIVARIGTEGGARFLVDHLLEADVTLRLRVIGALATLRARHPEIAVDRAAIEMVLMAEVMGHYRSYQILGTLASPLQSTDPVAVTLETSMRYEVERIFRLMAIRWPRFDVESAYVGVMADDARVRANALEFLDAVLKPQVRTLVLPLLDPGVTRRSASASPTRCSGRASRRTRTRCRRSSRAAIRGCARAAPMPSAPSA